MNVSSPQDQSVRVCKGSSQEGEGAIVHEGHHAVLSIGDEEVCKVDNTKQQARADGISPVQDVCDCIDS